MASLTVLDELRLDADGRLVALRAEAEALEDEFGVLDADVFHAGGAAIVFGLVPGTVSAEFELGLALGAHDGVVGAVELLIYYELLYNAA